MKATIDELPGCQIRLSLEFDANEVNAAFAQVCKDLNARGQVPGFRPGKTPKALLVRHYGEDAIRDSAKYELLGENVEEVLKDLELIGMPELPDTEDLEIAEDEPFELAITATVGPRVQLGDLTGLSLLKPTPEATDEDVADVLGQLQDTHAEEVKPDRDVVKPGDAVDLELAVALEDEAEPIDEVEQTIIVGEGDKFPPIDDKLLGRIVGQTVEMDVTYPEDYHDDSLAGKPASISAKIVGLRERRLPELNDEFARQLDEEKLQTIDDLKDHVRVQIDRERAEYSRQELENQINKALLERCQVDLPDILVQEVAERERESLSDELEEYGMAFEDLDDITGLDEEQRAANEIIRARRLLKIHAIMEELAKQHGEPTEEELEAEMKRYADEANLELSFVKQSAALRGDFRSTLSSRIQNRKVFDAIIQTADLQDIALEEYRSRRAELLRLPEEEDPSPDSPADNQTEEPPPEPEQPDPPTQESEDEDAEPDQAEPDG